MAAIKTILVAVERSDAGAALLAEAAGFAAARQAHLVALVIGIELTPSYAGLPDVPLDSYFTELQAIREEVREARVWAGKLLQQTGVSHEVRGAVTTPGDAGTTFARQARYADIAFVLRGEGDADWHRLVDAALFGSGRPVVLCPPGAALGKMGRRVALGWDAGAEAARAASYIADVVPDAEEVHVVMINPHVAPDAHGEEPGANIATLLARHGLPITVDALPREDVSTAQALMRQVRAIDADLVVAGAYGHSRLSEIILGGATRDLLETCDRPLLMAH